MSKVVLVLAVLLLSVGASKAQCSLTINQITTSGCYSVTGASKATVSVEVAWQNAPTNGYIVVTSGAQSRTITPGVISVNYGNGGTSTPTGSQTIVSPQVVAFEVNATGATGAITAQFSNSATCSAAGSYTTPAACLPTVCSSGSLGGQVFNDYNANGIKESGEVNGVGGVTVTIYPCVGSPVSVTTDAYGIWTTSATLVYPVRVEFSTIPETFLSSSTLQGINSRTTVQFINQTRCDVNLGINDPTDYCQDSPLLVLPLYISGNPLVSGSAATSQGLIGIPYNAAGDGTTTPRSFSLPTSLTGSLWAQAYHKETKRLFSAATLKRHAGLGPGGLDAIYITNLTSQSNPPAPTYINLSSLGIDVGASGFPANAARGLVGDKAQPSADPQSFSLIGTVGIGGMSMSGDGNTLYLMNIKNNSLYALNLSVYKTTLNTTDITLKSGPHAVPSLGCVGGTQRSWAVKFSKGKVYVGSVCDALSGSKSNLRAGVFTFDPSTNTFSPQPVFDFPLTYPKGYADWADPNITGWFPWSNSFANQITSITFGSGSNASITLIRPQPMLTDIEFDIDGSMILALSDRAGFQQGHRNYNLSGSGDYSGRVAGDLLRAFSRQGVFVLENAAKAGPVVGSRPRDNQGPGFGEFYVDDSGAGAGSDGLYHAEIGLGSLALRPGSNEVVTGVMDPTGINTPYSFIAFSGGIRHMNNTTGAVNNAFALYSSPTSGTRDGTFGKATGLGDLELLCNQQQLLELGNRIWLDEDKDGIQDACESVLAGVSVSLYRSGTLVATTTTNANGEYYFNNLPTSSTATGTVSTTNLVPNTAYQLVFGTSSQFANGVLTLGNGKYLLTSANSTSATANNVNDSDAQIATVAGVTAPVISLTTGSYGHVDHSFDVGFTCLPTTVGSISTTLASCSAGVVQTNARITVSGIQNADKVFLVTSGIPSYTATGSQPISASSVSFTGLSNPTSSTGAAYNVVLYNGPFCYTVFSTTLAQGGCCVLQGVTASASACNPATNQYTVSGTVSLTASPAQSLTISNGAITQIVSVTVGQSSVGYSLTGLTSGAGAQTITVTSALTANCGTSISTTYTAPASCTVGVSMTVTPGVCNTATNQYALTGSLSLTNATAGTATITDGALSTTVSVSAGATSVPYSVTGLTSGTGSHTLSVSFAGKTSSLTYVAPAACQVGLTLIVTPGDCQTATNQYSITGTLALTNAVAGTATLTDGTVSTTVAIAPGATSVTYSLSGLSSGTGSHTVVVSYASINASATYTAPVSCSVTIRLDVSAGSCDPATNSYSVSGTLSLTNAIAGVAILSDGVQSTTIAVTAGASTIPYSLSGLPAGTGQHNVTVAYASQIVSTTYTAPVACSIAITTIVTPGPCQSATNGYAISGILSLTNAIVGSAVIFDGSVTTTVSVSAGATSLPYSLSGLASGTGSHTVTITYAGQTVRATYVAPQSCTLGVAFVVTPGVCQSVTNTYTLTGVLSLTNAPAGIATFTDGTTSTTVLVSAGQESVNFSLTGLVSGSDSHTVTASFNGQTQTQTYASPASCTIGMAITATPGTCQSATNGYVVTGTLSVTNAIAGTVTITDGTQSTTVAVTVGATSIPYSLSGLTAGTGSHTVTATYAGLTSNVVYNAPLSCSIAPALSVVVTPGTCNTATNQYDLGVALSFTASPGGTITISDGSSTTTVTVAAGQTSATTELSGFSSGTNNHTVTVSGGGFTPVSATYAAPASCTVAPPCALSVVVTPTSCQSVTNMYALVGNVSAVNAAGNQLVTITDGTSSTTLILAANGPSSFTLNGLTSDGLAHTVTASATACGQVTATYTAPASCTPVGSAQLSLEKRVDKSKAKVGDVLTYTVVITNSGTLAATNVVVRDSVSTGLRIVPNSASSPSGTVFTQGTPASTWSISTISAGQSLSLTFQAIADSAGVLYNRATIPGDTVFVCTTIPLVMCAGDSYAFLLTVPAGRPSYTWYRDGVEIRGQTTNVLEITGPGSYSLATTSANGQCPDLSCCPFIVEEDSLPTFQAQSIPVSCIGNVAQANGRIVLSSFSAGHTYQYSLGSSFNASASLSGPAQPVPADGAIATNLANPSSAQPFTIRVYNRNGCYKDVTVILLPTVCGCPAESCMPFVLSHTKRAKRIGDPR